MWPLSPVARKLAVLVEKIARRRIRRITASAFMVVLVTA
jgi:hypothetical protein